MTDAKYVSVKGHKDKMAFIWFLDYYKHDILFSILVRRETYSAYWQGFKLLKRLDYPCKAVIADEHPAIHAAAKDNFPKARFQLCHTHILRNIRSSLDVRHDEYDKRFLMEVAAMFRSKLLPEYSRKATRLVRKYGDESKYLKILAELDRKHEQLVTYLVDKSCPRTSNLIECYNSHLDQRLRAIKGFESYRNAELWLNAYVVHRRITPFTDCSGRFKKLNGEAPLFFTVEDDGPRRKIQEYFGMDFRV
jgi:transposase-like protein